MEQSQSIYDRCDISHTQPQRRTLWGYFLDTRSPSTMSPPTSNYTYVSHPENHKLEHPTTHFNKLHQLLRQFLVINSMPSKHTFTTHYPIIYAQLRYLAEQYIPAVLQASDNHTLMNANISVRRCLSLAPHTTTRNKPSPIPSIQPCWTPLPGSNHTRSPYPIHSAHFQQAEKTVRFDLIHDTTSK